MTASPKRAKTQTVEPLQISILSYLPEEIQVAIQDYAIAAQLVPKTVIEFAIIHALDLESVLPNGDQNSNEQDGILGFLSTNIRVAIESYALEAEVPPKFALELAVTHFLDPDAVTFEDCQPGIRQERLQVLQQMRSAWLSQRASRSPRSVK